MRPEPAFYAYLIANRHAVKHREAARTVIMLLTRSALARRMTAREAIALSP
jgi:hypothetical protein